MFYYYTTPMTIIQKIKNFFKISNNSITNKEDERAVAEKRLNEQLAEDNKTRYGLALSFFLQNPTDPQANLSPDDASSDNLFDSKV